MAAAESAAASGAEFVVFPEVPSLHGDDNPDRGMLFLQLGGVAGQRLIPQLAPDAEGFAGLAAAPDGLEDLGTMALLVGDAVLDVTELENLAAAAPDLAVLIPRAESELQAEAFLELAIALSDSLAGLVLVAEAAGGDPGQPGHGGSAIISCGKVLAEAVGEEDVLVADVVIPLAQPEPRDALPELPTILKQRYAAHHGERAPVDYPADLTEGSPTD
jgi:predicted amidohydrolase